MTSTFRERLEEILWAVYHAHQEPHSSEAVIEVAVNKIYRLFLPVEYSGKEYDGKFIDTLLSQIKEKLKK